MPKERFFGRKKMKEKQENQLSKELLWLHDAPLFIDAVQLDRFYDATVRPANKEGTTTFKLSNETIRNLEGKLNAEAGLTTEKLAALLNPFFAFAKPSLKAAFEGSGTAGTKKGDEKTVEVLPISTPQRQLTLLAIYYLLNHQKRIFLVDRPAAETEWREKRVISEVPRALAFLNLPSLEEAIAGNLPSTKLIATAAEFSSGKISQIYKMLNFAADQPEYPEKGDPNELRHKRKEYWQWFDKNFSATKAMVAVENAVSENGKIQWIDYRLPITTEGDTLHLHICPSGAYDTGVLAYNFIKRGYKHGIRLVGTLKSEPDMNVLAIYER
jgi:hypothetical protein